MTQRRIVIKLRKGKRRDKKGGAKGMQKKVIVSYFRKNTGFRE